MGADMDCDGMSDQNKERPAESRSSEDGLKARRLDAGAADPEAKPREQELDAGAADPEATAGNQDTERHWPAAEPGEEELEDRDEGDDDSGGVRAPEGPGDNGPDSGGPGLGGTTAGAREEPEAETGWGADEEDGYAGGEHETDEQETDDEPQDLLSMFYGQRRASRGDLHHKARVRAARRLRKLRGGQSKLEEAEKAQRRLSARKTVTAVDLRRRTSEIIAALERNEELMISYRDRWVGIITPIHLIEGYGYHQPVRRHRYFGFAKYAPRLRRKEEWQPSGPLCPDGNLPLEPPGLDDDLAGRTNGLPGQPYPCGCLDGVPTK